MGFEQIPLERVIVMQFSLCKMDLQNWYGQCSMLSPNYVSIFWAVHIGSSDFFLSWCVNARTISQARKWSLQCIYTHISSMFLVLTRTQNSNYWRSCLAGPEFKSAMRQLIDFLGGYMLYLPCRRSLHHIEDDNDHMPYLRTLAKKKTKKKTSVTPLILPLPF